MSSMSRLILGAGVLGLAGPALAYPIDPSKRPVQIGQTEDVDHSFTLAYDNVNPNVVYYAPKGGRVALMNGMPLLGFALLPSGEGLLMTQLEFGVFGPEKQKLFNAITAAGKTAVPFPYTRTKVKPLVPGFNPDTGEALANCVQIEDPATGTTREECEERVFKELKYSQKGPSLGENVALTALLNGYGAVIYKQFLKGGNALQINLDAEYYKAGTSFKAVVTVDYDKLFENFHAYAAFHDGFCTDIEVETFWQKEGLCLDRQPSECGIFVKYVDDQGHEVLTPTIDPDDKEQQEKVLQSIERLRQKLEDEMLEPMAASLDAVDTSKPSFGFKLSAKYEKKMVGKKATFEFVSPNSVNVGETVIPAGVACVKVDNDGDVSRHVGGDCAHYWEGSYGFADILAKEAERAREP